MKLLAYRESLRRRLGVPSGDAFFDPATLDDALNEAFRTVDAEYRWPWNEGAEVVTIVAGTTAYPLPADWRASRAVLRRYEGGSTEPIPEVAPADVFSGDESASGAPAAWTTYDTDLLVYPRPDIGYTLTHLYYRSTPLLRQDEDIPRMPDQYAGIVVAGAAALLSTREDDNQARSAHREDYDEWLRRMRSAVRRQTGPVTPRVRPGGWVA